MTAVSLQCKIKNHHPEWSNVRDGQFATPGLPALVPGVGETTQTDRQTDPVLMMGNNRSTTPPSSAGRRTVRRACRPRTRSWRRSATGTPRASGRSRRRPRLPRRRHLLKAKAASSKDWRTMSPLLPGTVARLRSRADNKDSAG